MSATYIEEGELLGEAFNDGPAQFDDATPELDLMPAGTITARWDRQDGQAVIDFMGSSMASYTLGSNYTFIVERM